MAGNGHIPARPEPAVPQNQPRPAMFPRHQGQGTFGPPAPELCDLSSELVRRKRQPGRTRDAHSTKHSVVLHLGKLSAAHSAVQRDGARAQPLQIPTGLDVGTLWRCPGASPRHFAQPGEETNPFHHPPGTRQKDIPRHQKTQLPVFPNSFPNLLPRASRYQCTSAERFCKALAAGTVWLHQKVT